MGSPNHLHSTYANIQNVRCNMYIPCMCMHTIKYKCDSRTRGCVCTYNVHDVIIDTYIPDVNKYFISKLLSIT